MILGIKGLFREWSTMLLHGASLSIDRSRCAVRLSCFLTMMILLIHPTCGASLTTGRRLPLFVVDRSVFLGLSDHPLPLPWCRLHMVDYTWSICFCCSHQKGTTVLLSTSTFAVLSTSVNALPSSPRILPTAAPTTATSRDVPPWVVLLRWSPAHRNRLLLHPLQPVNGPWVFFVINNAPPPAPPSTDNDS